MLSRCCVCGREIGSPGRESPVYCREHRHYARRDDMILQNISLEDTFRIVTAILIRARDDYILNADGQRSDAEVFFKSNWAQIMTNGELNAELTLRELDRRIYELKQTGEYFERAEWE